MMILVDIVILVTLCVLIFATRTISPTRTGFFCDDLSIRYPYKENTITSKNV